jgi:hypothetical protein
VRSLKELIFKHVSAVDAKSAEPLRIASPDKLVKLAFESHSAFEELVRSAEGVARDGLGILARAASHASTRASSIGVRDVRTAAGYWFDRDKRQAIDSPSARVLMHYIEAELIERHFTRLLLTDATPDYAPLAALVDARILHIVGSRRVTRGESAMQYSLFKIDYGWFLHCVGGRVGNDGLARKDVQRALKFVMASQLTEERLAQVPVLSVEKFKVELLASRPLGQGQVGS